MPYKPLKPCAYPGCPKLTAGTYCEEHKKLRDKEYNIYGRDEFSKKFYKSREWVALRKRKLAEQPFCEECLKVGKVTKATTVDHIVPIKQGGAPLSLTNLQCLCWSCHSQKSATEGSRWGGNIK